MLLVGASRAERGRRALARCLLAVATLYFLIEAIGRLAERARPFATHQRVRRLVEHSPERSFPSRHVASATAMAIIVKPASPQLACLMGCLALGLGLTRIRAGLHYPSDALAGALLGGLVGRALR